MARTDMVMTGITKSEAKNLLGLLKPLSGWRIPNSTGKAWVSVDRVIDALEAMIADAGSLEGLLKPFDDGDEGDLSRYPGMADGRSEAAFTAVEMREDMKPFLELLTPSEKRIVDLLYGISTRVPLNRDEIAARLGMTPQAVSDHHMNALRRMRGDMAPGRNGARLNGKATPSTGRPR
jgi:DNA-directed RNA polymerase sigma subunit (sigma70/sigma32)